MSKSNKNSKKTPAKLSDKREAVVEPSASSSQPQTLQKNQFNSKFQFVKHSFIPPEMVEEYNKAVPDLGTAIMQTLLKRSDHRMDLEKYQVTTNRHVVYGTLLYHIVGIGAAVLIAIFGNVWAGIVTAAITELPQIIRVLKEKPDPPENVTELKDE